VSAELRRRHPDQVGCSDLIDGSFPADQVAAGPLHGQAQRLGGGEERLFGFEVAAFVGVAERCPLELGDLEAQEVDLSSQLPPVPPDLGEAAAEVEDLGTVVIDFGRADPSEMVQRLALSRLVEQRLVGVLTVEIDQLVAQVADPTFACLAEVNPEDEAMLAALTAVLAIRLRTDRINRRRGAKHGVFACKDKGTGDKRDSV